jgi:hypothetical protein
MPGRGKGKEMQADEDAAAVAEQAEDRDAGDEQPHGGGRKGELSRTYKSKVRQPALAGGLMEG